MSVEKDKVVSMHYTLTLENDEVIDSSVERNEPLQFIAGVGNIIPGLEKELIGMEKGDKKSVRVAPEEAYGLRNDELVQTYPRSELPAEVEMEVGKMLYLEDEHGHPVDALVSDLTEETVTLDLNHPLSGEVLNFEVEIIELREATSEELEHGHVHVDGHHH